MNITSKFLIAKEVGDLYEISLSLVVLLLTRVTAFLYQKKWLPEHFGDDLAHLSIVQRYKQTNGQNANFDWLYPLGKSDYPTGFHYLIYLTKLPIAWLQDFGGVLPMIFDAILVLMVGYITFLFTGDVSWWIVLLPLCRLFYEHDGRSIHFSERAFGLLSGSVFLTSIFLIRSEGIHEGLYALSLLSFMVFATSSKFAIQAVTFFVLILSVLYRDIGYLLDYVICFGIACVFSKGYVLKVYSGLFRHSVFYYRVLANKHPTIKNHYKDFLLVLTSFSNWRKIFKNSLFKTVLNNPFNIGLFYCVLNLPIDSWMIFSLVGVFLNLIISFRPFSFLGEPERYLEYSLLPSFVVFAKNVESIPLTLKLLILVLFIGLLFQHYLDFVDRCKGQNTAQRHMPVLKEWFSQIQNAVILPIPFRYGLYIGYEMTPEKSNKILGMHANVGEGQNIKRFEALLGPVYPFPKSNIDELIRAFNIDYILVDKAAVAYFHKNHPDYFERFNKYEVVNESPIFMLVKP